MTDSAPELAQPPQAVLRLVAGDDGAIDGADRGADDPVGLDALFAQGFVDAGLIGAERAAALEHQHGLPDRPVDASGARALGAELGRAGHHGLHVRPPLAKTPMGLAVSARSSRLRWAGLPQ